MSGKNILQMEKSAMERWRSGDPMGWAEISADEITYVDPGLTKPIIGLEDYRRFLKTLEDKIHYQHSDFIDPRIVLAGDAAVLTYNYRSSSDDSTASTLWNTTEVYARLAGEWKIVHTHWSFVNHTRPAFVEIPLPVELTPPAFSGILGEVMALESTAMNRWRNGDPYGFIEISSPEVTYFDTGTAQRVNGRDALKQLYDARAGQIFYQVMDFIDPQVQVHGDLAVLFYRFLSTFLNPDGSIASRTPWNCTEVYIKHHDTWQIAHTHWSLIQGVIVGVK